MNTAAATTLVTVAIPTYRRPESLTATLGRVLVEADRLREVGPHEIRVVVVDNDPEESGRSVVEALDNAQVRHVAEPRPGISAVRNRALDEAAGAEVLAFIDDDELPHENWLVHLLHTWRESDAAAVTGRVVPEYDGELDPWIAAGRFFVRRQLPTGTPVDVVATGNLLLDIHQVVAAGVRFDEKFGLTGGEDTLFSTELARAGRQLVWCNEAVVTDRVPRSRMTRRWVLVRAMSHGNTTGFVRLHLAASPVARWVGRLRNVTGGLARIVGGCAAWAVGLATRSRRQQARGLRGACRGMGMIAAGLGLTYMEYGRDGRRWRWRTPSA